ncbi:hypothetical protein K1T71_009775 [Dendrolimus kikuchii]|uniref:Uncharacterized protein n=1 Tax=Dendrolimus kikuchii TaxID=765133 RepID=A0ACC1CTQ4_9NEOP|nr:hypothetical protein K1T71_009775 [Dendrolimus kikuchii]
MHNWRLQLLALIAILQPIASFTERSIVDGRQQCCDRQQDFLFRDTRLSLEASRRITRDGRLERRYGIYAGRRLDTKHLTLLIRDRTNPHKDKHEDISLSRTDYRLTTAATNRRIVRHFDKENLNQRTTGQRDPINSVLSRNDVESSLRSSRSKRSTLDDGKNIRRTASDTRINFLRERSYASKFRTNTAIEQEFQTSKYGVEQERFHNRNNGRISQERRSTNRMNDNNRKSRSREIATTGFRSIVSPTIEAAGNRREHRQNRLNPITVDHRVEYKRINVLNNRLNGRNWTPEKSFERFADGSSDRGARLNEIRRKAITARVQQHEFDVSPRFKHDENRKRVSDIEATRRVVRNFHIDYRENRRDIPNYEMSRRVIVNNQDRGSMYTARDISNSQRVETTPVRKEISNPSNNYRYVVNKDRIRNSNARDDKYKSFSVTKDTAGREMTRRQTNVVEWEPSSDIRDVESDGVRGDNVRREFSQRHISTEDRNRQTKFEIEKRQSARRVVSQLTRRNSVDHESARKDTTHNIRTDQMRRSERGQNTRDSVIQQLNIRNTRDEERRKPAQTQSRDTRRVEYATHNTRVVSRASIRRDTRHVDRTRQQYVQDSSTRLSKDMRHTILHITRKDTTHDMTVRERTEDKMRTGDARRHTEITLRVEMRKNRRDINNRESNHKARSLDRIKFHDSNRIERFSRSIEFSERFNARQLVSNAKNDNRDRRSTDSRLHSPETVRNRYINKELSKINYEEQITGNWQMVFYILQGIYMWSIIAQAFKENGSTKPKTK